MTSRRLVIHIQDYWLTGTGRGGVHDAATRLDSRGLPYLPARHLRGLLRDAMTLLAEFRPAPRPDDVTALFGTRRDGEENEEGLLEVRNAVLPPQLAEVIAADPSLRAALFAVLRQTAMNDESGTARDRSLRSAMVAVPMTLIGEVAWREEAAGNRLQSEWETWLPQALALVFAVGAKRNRGLGRAWLELAP